MLRWEFGVTTTRHRVIRGYPGRCSATRSSDFMGLVRVTQSSRASRRASTPRHRVARDGHRRFESGITRVAEAGHSLVDCHSPSRKVACGRVTSWRALTTTWPQQIEIRLPVNANSTMLLLWSFGPLLVSIRSITMTVRFWSMAVHAGA